MKIIEIEMSNNFFEYANKNIMGEIKAIEVIKELLKNENIKKPSNLSIKNCSICDLKYNGKNIKSCSITLYKHIINIGI